MMKKLSLEPDEHMKWIYDQKHPDYFSDKAQNLRELRALALRNAPKGMIDEARTNDLIRLSNKGRK